MTHSRPRPAHRTVRGLPALVALTAALALTGCSFGTGGSSDSAQSPSGGVTATSGSSAPSGTTCNLTGCTVVLQRGVDARASVLGVDVELVGVTGDQVNLKVAGQQVSVPLDGTASTSVAGFDVTVESASNTQIVLRVTRG